MGTSLLAGCVIFAVLGYMADIRNVNIDELGLEGTSEFNQRSFPVNSFLFNVIFLKIVFHVRVIANFYNK